MKSTGFAYLQTKSRHHLTKSLKLTRDLPAYYLINDLLAYFAALQFFYLSSPFNFVWRIIKGIQKIADSSIKN